MTKRRTDIEAVRLDIEQRGARIVYESLLEVCQDRKAPAQARAAAGVAVLRAGGLFDAKRRPALDDDPAEMSAEELQRAMPLLQDELAQLEARLAEGKAALDAMDDDDGGVFA